MTDKNLSVILLAIVLVLFFVGLLFANYYFNPVKLKSPDLFKPIPVADTKEGSILVTTPTGVKEQRGVFVHVLPVNNSTGAN